LLPPAGCSWAIAAAGSIATIARSALAAGFPANGSVAWTRFKERHRAVWDNGYTELFFLDEPTALAAGHRPCFECRRRDAVAFAASWAAARAEPAPPRAAEMDRVLHAERLDGRGKRSHSLPIDDLPDGAMLTIPKEPPSVFAVRREHLLPWTPNGYGDPRKRPRGVLVNVLTPPSILAVVAHGYHPQWHPSAEALDA
jgi:hypothetical protein